MHLVQPIEIDGTKYCVKHGATTPKWRTVSHLSDGITLYGVEDDDKWVTVGSYLSFATCCLWKATVRFTATSLVAGPGVWYQVDLNGVTVGGDTTGTLGTYDVVVDLYALGLMGRACGNLWDITAVFGGTVEIVDVTFGPPL
jgi:hypothetical protein